MSKLITYRSKLKTFYLNWFIWVLFYVEINIFKVKIDKCPENEKKEEKRIMLLHARIGHAQIERPACPSFCVYISHLLSLFTNCCIRRSHWETCLLYGLSSTSHTDYENISSLFEVVSSRKWYFTRIAQSCAIVI